MVLMINGVPLEEAPRDVPAFLTQYPHFKESASRLDIYRIHQTVSRILYHTDLRFFLTKMNVVIYINST